MFLNESKFTEVKAELEAAVTSIEKQLADLGATPPDWSVATEGAEGFADSAHATAERSEQISTIERLVADRTATLAALDRIEAGTFGTCERCGNPIQEERLEALPTVTLCLDCKRLSA
jgi:DnaK suppressor protein